MNPNSMALRKRIVGLLSLVSLLIAVVSLSFMEWTNPLVSVTSRLGVMLGVLWLALPNEGDNLLWEKAFPVVIAVIGVLAFIKRGGGRLLLYVIPAAIVVGIALAFIRPKPRRRPTRR
jgi:hypothetical protein